MANSSARMFLRNGGSFSHLLRSRLVGRPSNVDVCIRDQLLAQSLTNPTQRLFLQRPASDDGANLVDFVVGKDQKLMAVEQGKSSDVMAASRGSRSGDESEDDDYHDDDDMDDDDLYDDDDDNDFDDDNDEDDE